jgi:hypothetical protein
MHCACSKFRGRRPCADGSAAVEVSGRLLLCKRCRALMLVGSCCDRGQVYCVGDCAKKARRQSMREAGKRYQASKKGRLAHAARQHRYCERKRLMAQQVTTAAQNAAPAAAAARAIPSRDHGQCLRRRREVLREIKQANWLAQRVRTEWSDICRQKKKVTHQGSPPPRTDDLVPADTAATRLSHCHWCGRLCSPFVRNRFLRR